MRQAFQEQLEAVNHRLVEMSRQAGAQIRTATTALPAADMQPVLAIHCPNVLFPYARETVADAIRAKGLSAEADARRLGGIQAVDRVLDRLQSQGRPVPVLVNQHPAKPYYGRRPDLDPARSRDTPAGDLPRAESTGKPAKLT